MKTKNWLWVSGALNVIAVALFIALLVRPAPRPAGGNLPTGSATPTEARHRHPEPQAVPVVMESTNAPSAWVQSLRAAGVAEKLVADVVAADFDDRWQKRMRDMQKQFDLGDVDEIALEQFYASHDVEQERELRTTLGEEGFLRWDRERILRDYDPAGLKLSSAESDALYQLRKDLDRQRRDLDAARRKGDVSEIDVEKQSETSSAQFDQQLKALLGEDRYALLPNAENDPNLGQLRRNLRSIKATDAQLDAMIKAQQQWNEQRLSLEKQIAKGDLAGTDYEQQMKAIEAARDKEFQQVLGGDAFAEYQRQQDGRYRTMKRFGPAWGLSDSDISSLYGMIQSYESSVRDYQQRAQAIEQQGEQVDWAAVQKALQDYSKQTEQLLIKTLGEERFNKLKKNNVLALEQ
jgi:hypothetical protein